MKGYNPQRVIKLLAETPGYYLNDAASMYGKVIKAIPKYQLPNRPRSAKELHDDIMRDFNRVMENKAEEKKLPTDKLGHKELLRRSFANALKP